VLQSAAVHVKVKDNRGSFVSDPAVWGSEVAGAAGAGPGPEAEGTPLELCRTVEGRRDCDKESRAGGGRRSRKIWGRAMRSIRNGSIASVREQSSAQARAARITLTRFSTPPQSVHASSTTVTVISLCLTHLRVLNHLRFYG
jgi:hypothetical protein